MPRGLMTHSRWFESSPRNLAGSPKKRLRNERRLAESLALEALSKDELISALLSLGVDPHPQDTHIRLVLRLESAIGLYHEPPPVIKRTTPRRPTAKPTRTQHRNDTKAWAQARVDRAKERRIMRRRSTK